jgi:putative flippase GtrA
MKQLIEKYKDLIPYAVFGVLTTLVNIVGYWILAHPLGLPVMVSTVIAWILSVLFAYLTNRKWVFHSEAKTNKEVLREAVSFFAARLATGIVDWAAMLVFVDMLKLNDVVIKTLANIIVIILNYAASKFLIFKKRT